MGPFPRRSPSILAQFSACFSWTLGFLLLVLMTACASQKTPDLLEIHQISPGVLEAGTEIQIEGNGFPEHRRGSLILSGTAHTPARPPREVSWELPLIADSRSIILVHADSRILQGFTEGAAHVTFRGDARIHFNPLIEGRPPLRGKKKGLVLDLFAPATEVRDDPEAFLAFVGLDLGDDLVVKEVLSSSVADRAGLRVGDRLHTLDGVRLDSRRDVLPQAQAHMSVIEYSRPGFRGTTTTQIDRASFQLLDLAMAARALAMICGVALALLWAARPPRFLLWLFGEKSKARRGRVVWLSGVGPRAQALAYPVFLGVVLLFWFLLSGFGARLAGLEFVAAVATGGLLLLIAAFLLGGKKSDQSGFTLLGAFSSTVVRLIVLLPVLIAAFARASGTGSLELAEIARDQGALPHQWALFDSPFQFLLGGCYLMALLPLSGRRAPLEGHPGAAGAGLVLARLSEWTGHLVLMGLWVALFAGGSLGPSHLGILGGVLFSTKVALLAHLVAWTRARTGHLRLAESWGVFGLSNLAASLLAASLSFGLLVSGLSDTHAEVLGLFSATLAGSLVVLFIISSQRSWAHMGRRIDPWI